MHGSPHATPGHGRGGRGGRARRDGQDIITNLTLHFGSLANSLGAHDATFPPCYRKSRQGEQLCPCQSLKFCVVLVNFSIKKMFKAIQ